MLITKITVNYDYNYRTHEYCLNAQDKYPIDYVDRPKNSYWSDYEYTCDTNDITKSNNRARFWAHYSYTFTNFTNKGKVSKTELKNLDMALINLIKPIAENKAKQIIKLMQSTKSDMKQAVKLANIINHANWHNLTTKELAVIKVKTSHSKWYNNVGSLHAPSQYLTIVPLSVAKEAKELQCIRKKHQTDPNFDFAQTAYYYQEIRVADHPTKNSDIDIDNSDNWETLYNISFL